MSIKIKETKNESEKSSNLMHKKDMTKEYTLRNRVFL